MKFALPLLSAVTLTLTACSQPADAPATAENPATTATGPATVLVEDAWCRTSPNGAKVGGCYVTLTASNDDVLKGVSTAQADMAQVHEMKHEDGIMKMAHLENGLPLPAGQATALKPHGNHIMLMGLKAPLMDGTSVKITLTFDKAEPQTVDFAIRTPEVVDSEE